MAQVPDLFGIDVGNFNLKVSRIKENGQNNFELKAIGTIETKGSILELFSKEDIDDLVKKIKDLVKESKVGVKNCVASISESNIYSRLVTLPEVPEKEIDEAIHWAAKPLMPVDIDTMNVSYSRIDDYTKDNKKYVNWYVVGAPKEIIQKYQDLFSKTGLNLLAIETEALALARMFFVNYQITADVLLVDIGAENTNIVIARNKAVVFSQTINTGANSFTKVIASDYGIDMKQAEEYKVNYGMDFQAGDGKIANAIAPVADLITSEVSRTISYYKNKIGGNNIEMIYLTGGGSNLKKLDEYFKTKLNIESNVINTFNKIKVSKGIQEKMESFNIPSFNIAIGLSLKGRI